MDFRLTQSQAARLPRLLYMEYTLQELSDELDVEARHLRHALEVGAPHRETRQAVFIIGEEFRNWYETNRRSKKQPLAEGEFYCLKCRKGVRPDPDSVSRTALKNLVIQERAKCPNCGGRVNRFVSGEEL